MNCEISIIIPAFNEADSIAATLDALESFENENVEIILVDGGSLDDTIAIAQNYDVKILHSPRGRGAQLQIGGAAANGDILWFLHADTIAPPNAVFEIKRALKNPRIGGGNFTIRFDGTRFAAKFLTRLYPKLNLLGLIYGDSAIFVRRKIYDEIGGFRDYPIFEDLDFVERLRKTGEIITLQLIVKTSSRRFERKSFLLTFFRWMILQGLYWLGVSPETLFKIYFPDAKIKER